MHQRTGGATFLTGLFFGIVNKKQRRKIMQQLTFAKHN